MENEEMKPNYWPSVLIGAITVGILVSIGLNGVNYYIASSEPGVGALAASGGILVVGCLLGLIGGFISTRHYAKTHEVAFTIGQGALIGLFTGLISSIIVSIVGYIIYLFDPTLPERVTDVLIQTFETMEGMTDAQREQSIIGLEEGLEEGQSIVGVLKQTALMALILGFVNLLSGMIGAKIFASEEE